MSDTLSASLSPRVPSGESAPVSGRRRARDRVRAPLSALLEELAARQPGAKLPSQMELAQRFSTSARVISQLFAEFSRQGRVYARPGLGAFLLTPNPAATPAPTPEAADGTGEKAFPETPARTGTALLLLGNVNRSESNWSWQLFRDIEEWLRLADAFHPVAPMLCPGAAEAVAFLEERRPAALALLCARGATLADFPGLAEWLLAHRSVKTGYVSFTRIEDSLQEIDDLFCLDDFGIGRMAFQHLASLGHRRPVMFGCRTASCAFLAKRRAGFLDAARLAGLRAEYVEFPDLAPTQWAETGAAAGAAWVENRLGPDGRPTGVFCLNDIALIPFLQTVERAGFSVPRDVSLIGVDNEIYPCLSALGYLPTTIDIHMRRFAPALVERLRRRLSGEASDTGRIVHHVCPGLVVRGTTAPPPRAG